MQKHYSIVLNYFSLLTGHVNEVVDFNNKADIWLLNADNFYFEALTNSIFKKNLISFPQKIIITVQEISNLSKIYLEKLHLLSNVLETLIKIESSDQK